MRRTISRLDLSSTIAVCIVSAAIAQTPPAAPPAQTPPPGAPATAPPQQPLPWPVQLGLRVEQVNQAFPLIDRVVLVPDAATYLDELAKWSPAGRWPVLIEDEHLAPMFLRRFAPAQLIRRESIGKLNADNLALQKQIEAVVIRTFGGDPNTQSIAEAFKARNVYPCGVVIASASDPAWTAAAALAAGHGQAIAWLDGSPAKPSLVLGSDAADKFLARVAEAVQAAGYPGAALGDVIDAVTICRDMAGRVNAGGKPPQQSNILAMTDLIGRGADSSRWALAGWIFGNETRSAYMAMSALFLPRSRVLLYNTYPTTDGWGTYGVGEAATVLEGRGYEVKRFDGASATANAWASMILPGGVTTDVFAMNTKGNSDFFDMSKGQLHPDDVPILNTPAAVHFIHSWSLLDITNPATVGGRWLTRGVYAYVGAGEAPGRGGGITPHERAHRWTRFVPFLVATRRWESTPWKVHTIGDPLMLCRPPSDPPPRPRVSQPADYGADVGEAVKEIMRSAKDDSTGRKFGAAIRDLELLGKDEIAAQLWRAARDAGQTAFAARPALGPLFRLKQTSDFLAAWDDAATHDPLAVDMLWHLLSPRFTSPTVQIDQDTLRRLASNIRRPQSYLDFERIAPLLTSAFGQAHTRSVLQRELEATQNPQIRAKLQNVMKRH